MDPKKLEKYFSLSDTKYLVGSCMLVVAFIFVWLGMAYNWYMFLIGIAAFVVGLFLFITGSIGRIGMEDVDKARDDKLRNFGQEMIEDPHIIKRMAEHATPVYIKSYDYEGVGLESRHSKDNIWRTSQCTAFRIVYLHDAIVVIRRTFSLLSDYDETTPATEYKFSELGKAEILRDRVRLTSGKNSYDVGRARLRLTDKDGNELFLVQVPDDMDSDDLATFINRAISHGNII